MKDENDTANSSPFVRDAIATLQAQTDARLVELADAGKKSNTPVDAVASPIELQRTAVRIMLIVLHRGLEKTPAKIRQLPEARRLSQALYAASAFFNGAYDPARCAEELRKLCGALVAFSEVTRTYDPWMLWLYAVGDLKARKRKGEPTAVPLRR